ncbi:MAG: replication initiator protein A [Deltaproteobacteria bacterium]|nr:replication initiator protein A [Deltaproteobacteria bacterium]
MQRVTETLARLEQKAREHKARTLPSLLPDRHPVQDYFVADVLDWALKADRHSMEHPMFSLSKTPDRTERHYEHQGRSLTIMPSSRGLATIWDKDILLYCISVLMDGLNRGRDISRIVRLKAYDLLVVTNRSTGGDHYKRLEAAFDRLAGTRIKTNITTNGVRVREGFGLIDNWKIIERAPGTGRMIAVEVTLNEWLYNAIVAREVLTLNRDYFRLDGGLERRLYELARKHCGNQAKWLIGLELLHKKSGSAGPVKRFRELVKKIAAADLLPDYRISYEPQADLVMFYTKDSRKLAESLASVSAYQ